VQHFVEGAEQISRKEGPEKRSAASFRQKPSFARLTRYEYGLVLKLDRNNFQAREGLRHLLIAVQSR
jgi:hypothetical protein